MAWYAVASNLFKGGLAWWKRRRADQEAWRELEDRLLEVRRAIADAMFDPNLALDLREELAAVDADLAHFHRRIPPEAERHVAVLIDDLHNVQALCDRWENTRVALDRAPAAEARFDVEHERLVRARADHERTWRELRAAAERLDASLPAVERFGHDRFNVAPLSESVPLRERERQQEPLSSTFDRDAPHTRVASAYDEAARALVERQGRPAVRFDQQLTEPKLAWLTATRLGNCADGAYASRSEDQHRIDELWSGRAHLPDHPPMSDEMKVRVLTAAYPEHHAELHALAVRLQRDVADHRALDAAAVRREAIDARGERALPGAYRKPDPAAVEKSYSADPEQALLETRERQEEARSTMERLGLTNRSDEWRQAQGQLRQAETDEIKLLSQLGRLDDAARETHIAALARRQADAIAEFQRAVSAGDRSAAHEANIAYQHAQRDERELRQGQRVRQVRQANVRSSLDGS
jgi:hypothetical protein